MPTFNRILFAAVLYVFLLAASLQTILFSEATYQNLASTSESSATSEDIKEVITAFRGEELGPSFSERDRAHIGDVRHLVQISQAILFVTLLFLIILVWKSAGRWSLLKVGSVGAGIALVVTALLLLLTFSSSFLLFHRVSFTNDLWMLDPAKDKLIQIFPEQFFIDATQEWFFRALGLAAVVWIVASQRIKKRMQA